MPGGARSGCVREAYPHSPRPMAERPAHAIGSSVIDETSLPTRGSSAGRGIRARHSLLGERRLEIYPALDYPDQ